MLRGNRSVLQTEVSGHSGCKFFISPVSALSILVGPSLEIMAGIQRRNPSYHYASI